MKKRVLFTLACLFLWTGMAMAQVSRITGVVVSAEDNEPIVGASVLVKGTTLGTITDMNGRYSINNIPVNAKSLVISFVGMKTQELAIKAVLGNSWYTCLRMTMIFSKGCPKLLP